MKVITRKISKLGNSRVISIPRVLLRLGILDEDLPVSIAVENGKIIISQEKNTEKGGKKK